jgi:hypothetical protein
MHSLLRLDKYKGILWALSSDMLTLAIYLEKERTGHCEEKIISSCRPYYEQIHNFNLEISQAIIKINCQNWSMHSKVSTLSKTLQPL